MSGQPDHTPPLAADSTDDHTICLQLPKHPGYRRLAHAKRCSDLPLGCIGLALQVGRDPLMHRVLIHRLMHDAGCITACITGLVLKGTISAVGLAGRGVARDASLASVSASLRGFVGAVG